LFQVFDGEFELNLNDVPLVGRPDAPHVMVSLFDYTCHFCRELHGPLMEASRLFSNDLAIVSLPMPLDPACNPVVTRIHPDHTNACALARVGLAVWRADRKASTHFDDWVFGPPRPPQPEAAAQFARQLVGSNAFERALLDPWIEARIQQDIALFKSAYQRFRKGAMPELIIGTNLTSGPLKREQLFRLLAEQFSLRTNSFAAPLP
jgi:hypothetical protein